MSMVTLALVGLMNQSVFGQFEGKDVNLYTLKNRSGVTAKIMDYGATVVSLTVPDRKGKAEEVTLGFPKFDDYLTKSPYFGCIVGRIGNRIRNGQFILDGTGYDLESNDKANTLHGGLKGFDKRIWEVVRTTTGSSAAISFKYVSADGEGGYPGELTSVVTYTLTAKNELKIDYVVTANAKTIHNLTNHTYFNLEGPRSKNHLNHVVQIAADYITPVDETLIPTGELMPVKDTAFDFTRPHAIGERIDAPNQQITYGGGYDHNFVVRGKSGTLRPAATVYEPKSGRVMEVLTTEPGVQFYSGNFLDGTITGHGGAKYTKRYGFCLETQHFPDAVNQPNFESVVINPGETYKSTTIYRFSTRK
jgi:aldose 1-epimerase